MMKIRRPIGFLVVCALTAMILSGCAQTQLGRDCAAAGLSRQECAAYQMMEDRSRPGSLCATIESGNVDRAMQLVKQGEDVNAGDGCALIAATQQGQLELVKFLLEHKADPNRNVPANLTVFIGGSTPLMLAVVSRKVQMVQMLLEGGANPRNDIDSFDVVLNFGDAEMAELLLRHGANANMTHPADAPVYYDVEIRPREYQSKEVPRRDLEPDRIDETVKRLKCAVSTRRGESLLYRAAGGRGGPKGIGGPGSDSLDDIVKLLLGHGADPNAKTLIGSTPLMYAASQHHHRIITMLMDAGADVKATDRCGRTAEDYAFLYPRDKPSRLAPQTKALLQERQRK